MNQLFHRAIAAAKGDAYTGSDAAEFAKEAGVELPRDFAKSGPKRRMPTHVCSICHTHFAGFGNNPVPYLEQGSSVCCDFCNMDYVIPCRIGSILPKGGVVVEEVDDSDSD